MRAITPLGGGINKLAPDFGIPTFALYGEDF